MRSGGLIDLALGGEVEDLSALREWREITAEQAAGGGAHQIVRRGDVWLLGEHRLLCGDSTRAADVGRVLAGAKPHLMVTDPPYGINYSADWREKLLGGKRAVGIVQNDAQADWTLAWRLFPGDVAYVWHSPATADSVLRSLLNAGFKYPYQIIWVKKRFVIGRSHYHSRHEPCYYAIRKGVNGHWQGEGMRGDRSQDTVWEIEHYRSETGHSTQKPLECMARPIRNNSQEGDAVYEPFSGSGTTIIACEQLRRKCYAIEIDPRYVYITLMRYQEQTGRSVTLEETDENFAAVVARRKTENPVLGEGEGGEREQENQDSLFLPSGFDPVLAEYIYSRWSAVGSNILDLHEDDVRRAVAGVMGRRYNDDGAAGLLLYCPQPDAAVYAAWLGHALDTVRGAAARAAVGSNAVVVCQDARHADGFMLGAPYHTMQLFVENRFLLNQQIVFRIAVDSPKYLFAFKRG